MAGWPILRNGSASGGAAISNGYQGDGCCLDINHAVKDSSVVDDLDDDFEVKLRSLFDQVLSVLLNKAAGRGRIRPNPALLSDGQPLDLFKLFWVVRQRGGFDLVNGFWTFVAKELGVDIGVSASIKLIYFKYLYELERCLRKSSKYGRLGNRDHQSGGKFGFLSLELEMQFRSLLSCGYDQRGKVYNLSSFEYKKNGKYIDKEVGKGKIGLVDPKGAHIACNGVGNWYRDDDENFHVNGKCCNDDDNDLMISDLSIGKKKFNLRKRKRESLSRMLNWVIQIAKCPDDPSMGEIPLPSKWKDYKGAELWVQAIRARDALLRRKWADSNTEQSLLQNNQKIHPSMYEDVSLRSGQPAEKSRCSERLPAAVKRHLCSCCNSCSGPQSKLTSPIKTVFKNGLTKQERVANDLMTLSPSDDEHLQRHVSVGPRFQAEVPEWTGIVFGSDSKWLGTQVWPLEYEDHNVPVAMDPIGKGRLDLCACHLPGSVGCVRFHIAEERMKLKLELRSVFCHWRFDHMGEEVSLRWTAEEEKRFKDMVMLNAPSLGKCFWEEAHKYFPRKTREELVSYYFNVFQNRRRSYQNRVTPKNIDSDDDELEFGSLSDDYGHEALKVPGAYMLICSENKQCTDFN